MFAWAAVMSSVVAVSMPPPVLAMAKEKSDLQEWAHFINTIGVPVALLIFGCFCIWRTGCWLAKVGGPLIDSQRKANERTAEALTTMPSKVTDIEEHVDHIKEKMQELFVLHTSKDSEFAVDRLERAFVMVINASTAHDEASRKQCLMQATQILSKQRP